MPAPWRKPRANHPAPTDNPPQTKPAGRQRAEQPTAAELPALKFMRKTGREKPKEEMLDRSARASQN